ncbi:MAG: hypothetical protein ACK5A3_11495 [Planctomyces sp.]
MARTVTTPYAADWIPPQTLTGAELCRWMRRFRTTIRDLAQRMGITQRRIRECRRAGLGNPHAVRDWLEAITGHDPGTAAGSCVCAALGTAIDLPLRPSPVTG